MAAPCRLCGVLRLGAQFSKLETRTKNLIPQLQQIRNKGEGRRRIAGAGQDSKSVAPSSKWVHHSKKVQNIVSETIPTGDLKRNPVDNVWIAKYYMPKEHSIQDAIQMHREFCQPAMLNNPSGLLKLSMLLDLRTKKKTKFMSTIKKTIVPPHIYDESSKNKVMVFVKDDEQRVQAEKHGAAFVGGVDLVKTIEKGEIRYDDFDHVVCHVDTFPDITTIRKFLRDNFPNKKTGNLGGNVLEMLQFFQYGVTYESEVLEEALGQLTVTLGRLDMTDDQLVENFDAFMEAICAHRTASLGQFISRAVLTCPPSPEKLVIDGQFLLSVSQRSTKQAKLEQEEEEPAPKADVDSDDDEPIAMRK